MESGFRFAGAAYKSIIKSALIGLIALSLLLSPAAGVHMQPESTAALASVDDATQTRSVLLHIPADDFTSIISPVRSVVVLKNESAPEVAVKSVLAEVNSVPKSDSETYGIYLMSFQVSYGVATLGLMGDVDILNPQQLFYLTYALTNTLTEFPEIYAVNTLYNSSPYTFEGDVTGAFTRFGSECYIEYTNLMKEVERGGRLSPRKNIITYSLSKRSDLIIPEFNQAYMERPEDTLNQIISLLSAAPKSSSQATRALPPQAYAENVAPTGISGAARTLIDDEGYMHLDIKGGVNDYIERNQLSQKIVCAALGYSIMNAVPGVNGVYLRFDGELARDYVNGLVRRGDVEMLVGSEITLYFPQMDGASLKQVMRVVPAYESISLSTYVSAIMEGPHRGEDESARRLAPDNILPDDFLNISVSQSGATINISQNFYEYILSLSSQEERTVIYSLVNTFCGVGQIRRVRFMVEGTSPEYIHGRLNISDYLIKNIGIIAGQE